MAQTELPIHRKRGEERRKKTPSYKDIIGKKKKRNQKIN